jgi:fermentation-respiration switch protein FrsA (DUF1100 family)
MKTLMIIAAVIAVVYVIAVSSIYGFQRRLIYFPDAERESPSDAGLSGVREVVLQTPDGERLIAWYKPAAPGKPTLLYFHGNAGTLSDRADRIKRFSDGGYGVFMPSYRGYSGSTGSPSETAIIADAHLAYDHLRGMGIAERAIVVYGESLGSGVAVQLAADRTVGAVVLDAPYTSLPDVGKLLYPYLPVQTFMVDRFESRKHILKVRAPILIMHGTDDRVVPIALGKALFEAAPQPKEMAVLQGAGHSNIYSFGAFARMDAFLRSYVGKAAAPGNALAR